MALDNEFRKRESKFCTERQPSYKNWLRKGSFFLWFSMVVISIAVMIGLYSRVVYFLWTRSNNVELTHRQKVGFCQGLSSSDEIQWSLCNILSDYTSVLIARVILLSLETDSGVLRTVCQIHIPNNAPCFPQIFCQCLFSIYFKGGSPVPRKIENDVLQNFVGENKLLHGNDIFFCLLVNYLVLFVRYCSTV